MQRPSTTNRAKHLRLLQIRRCQFEQAHDQGYEARANRFAVRCGSRVRDRAEDTAADPHDAETESGVVP